MKKIKAFWAKLARNQKIAFSLLIALLILGPISVILTPKPVGIFEMGIPITPPVTPIPTPKPTPTSSPIPCTIGITSFSVSDYCGASNFRYAKYTCADNYAVIDGGPTSCKPIATWVEYATRTCQKHPSCPTPPSPKPTPKPTPKPSYQPSPLPSYWPTPIPTLVPQPSP